ncbi:MAG: gliding motility-associated C-terminal domain-containing protein [Saprospiraceae bacterium]|nr:gliding motility-associated C-terminal domain-containing protein [Saprospiraceae bacterium]
MALRSILLLAYIFVAFHVYAQPSNDDCSGLIDLGEAPICPVIGTFTNVDATGSTVFSNPAANIPSCFMGGQPDADVWFSFDVPIDGSIVDFDIIVSAVNGPNGPILQPQIAVYRGDCLLDELEELDCATSAAGESTVEITLSGLTPGFTYFLRIDDWSGTAQANWGDFELCIKEPDLIFNIGEEPGSNACTGTLFDSGGPDGNYQDNETYTFVVCPDQPTACIDLQIEASNIETNYDNLTIYEGNSTAGAQVANFTGASPAASIQIGSSCFTVLFDSDISISQSGFELSWSCSPVACLTTFVPCEQTSSIFFLPFQANGQTTCGSGDDVQEGPCPISTEALMGEDFIYTYNSQGDECISIMLTGVDAGTWLSIYEDCPESASNCMAVGQSIGSDTILIDYLSLNESGLIYLAISNVNCTDFNIQIQQVPCLQIVSAQSLCEDATALNTCSEVLSLFGVSPFMTTIPEYFQPGINDGCWDDAGAAHYTWLAFQAQVDGSFGFLANGSSDQEDANIDFQVWGPISDPFNLCDFVLTNQPIRSSFADENFEITGLTDTNPINGNSVSDACEDLSGDGFVSALPVLQDQFYLILLNDHSGNIINGHLEIDFSETSAGVLDGLPEGTPLSATPYETTGTAFHNPQNGDYSCIQLTANLNNQGGCAWSADLVDFSQPFINNATIYFGNSDAGADGICMVYHLDPDGFETCGVTGGEIGSGGIQNSLIIEFDTWQNAQFGDPFQDHIAVNVNGDMGSSISGPIVMPNLEDGQEHEVVFSWEPVSMTYEIYFDGALVITNVYDVVTNCFGGETSVYGGYTASTGGAFNLQYVCTGNNVYPTTTSDTTSVILCEGESYFAGGALQTTSGFYSDVYVAYNGCDSIIVSDLTFNPSFADTVSVQLCDGDFYFAGGADQTTSGIYSDAFLTINGCDSLVVTELEFSPNESSYLLKILCAGESYFAGGMDQTSDGIYTDTLINFLSCDSIVTTELLFLSAEANIEEPDPLNCENPDCLTLDASASSAGGPYSYEWFVSGGGQIEDETDPLLPVACGPGLYRLIVTNSIGDVVCADTAEVTVVLEIDGDCFDIEIPNAFSPNGDGLNDFFQLIIPEDLTVEIREFQVFNRWGQQVYNNENGLIGWDGKQDGEPAPSDVFAYRILYTIPILAQDIELSGEVTLLR